MAIFGIKLQKIPINTLFSATIRIDYEQNNESGVKGYETQPPPSKNKGHRNKPVSFIHFKRRNANNPETPKTVTYSRGREIVTVVPLPDSLMIFSKPLLICMNRAA